MRTAEEIIASLNPLACEAEPTYVFERGRILYLWSGGEHPVTLDWAKSRLPWLEQAPDGYRRFPIATAQLSRLADSLRVAIQEAEAEEARSA